MKIKILSLVAAVMMLTSEAFANRNFHCQDKSNSNLKFNVTINDENQLLSLNMTSMHDGHIILTNFFDLVPCKASSGNGYTVGTGLGYKVQKYFSSSGPSVYCAVSFEYGKSNGDGIIESIVNGGLQTYYEVTCKEL